MNAKDQSSYGPGGRSGTPIRRRTSIGRRHPRLFRSVTGSIGCRPLSAELSAGRVCSHLGRSSSLRALHASTGNSREAHLRARGFPMPDGVSIAEHPGSDTRMSTSASGLRCDEILKERFIFTRSSESGGCSADAARSSGRTIPGIIEIRMVWDGRARSSGIFRQSIIGPVDRVLRAGDFMVSRK